MEFDPSLIEGARRALTECMGIEAGEVCLIVTDEKLSSLAMHFAQASRDLQAETLMITMTAVLLAANCAFLITSVSMSHTKARGEVTKAGVRIASMPGFITLTQIALHS